MTVSQQLAEFGHSLRWNALPESIQRRARICLLDMLGATLAGSTTPTADLAASLAARHGPTEAAQLVGRPQRASVPFAALANGMACHTLEMDDGHRYAIGLHNAATTIPAALAVAEEQGADLEALLVALVFGYEVASRIGVAVNPAHRAAGFHSTGTIGVFGAAAAAALLRGLPAEQIARAIGIAGSASAGIFEFLSDASTVKHFHAGHAAMSGLLAADLAACGLTGPLSLFEGREGFCRIYGREADPAAITRDLGARFELEHVYFKLHAACAHIFATIDAVLDLRAEAGPTTDLERVLVRTYHAAAILDEPHARTTAAAKFSIPYCVAAAWLHGRASDELFGEPFLSDRALQELAGRIEVVEDPALEADFPRTRAAGVELVLRDGRRRETFVDVPRGMPERPASEDELVAKFRGLAPTIVGSDAAEELIELTLRGRHESVGQLLLQTVPGGAGPPSRRAVTIPASR